MPIYTTKWYLSGNTYSQAWYVLLYLQIIEPGKKCFSWLGVSAIVGVQCEVPRAVLLGCKSLNIFAKGFFWASSYHHVFLGTSTAGFVCCACYMHCILCPELHWSVINDHVAAVILNKYCDPRHGMSENLLVPCKKEEVQNKKQFFFGKLQDHWKYFLNTILVSISLQPHRQPVHPDLTSGD